MPRIATWVLFLAGLTLLPVTPISAAVPAFVIDTEVDGSTIHVTVTFQPVPVGFAWGSLEASGVLDELVGVVPADLVDGDGRPGHDSSPAKISLDRSEEGVYEGVVEVPVGTWAIVAWPFEPDFDQGANPGIPETRFVAVGGPPAWLWLAIGGAAAAVVAALSLHEPTQR